MQLVDSNIDNGLFIANRSSDRTAARHATSGPIGSSLSRLKATSASGRMLALLIAGLLVAASPVLLNTVFSVVSLSFQILLQAGHAGLIAFQIFGR
jgi:hypothetical protein